MEQLSRGERNSTYDWLVVLTNQHPLTLCLIRTAKRKQKSLVNKSKYYVFMKIDFITA